MQYYLTVPFGKTIFYHVGIRQFDVSLYLIRTLFVTGMANFGDTPFYQVNRTRHTISTFNFA